MKVLKTLALFIAILLPKGLQASTDNEEIIEIPIHSTTPSGGVLHAPQHHPITCYYIKGSNILTMSADCGEFFGAQITVTNLTTNEIEYISTSSSPNLNAMTPLSGNGYFYIEIELTSSERTYYGYLFAY